MRPLIVALLIATAPLAPPDSTYVSCIDGHIVEKLSDCPPIPDHSRDQAPPIGGGGRRGLLGLGGIGGIL